MPMFNKDADTHSIRYKDKIVSNTNEVKIKYHYDKYPELEKLETLPQGDFIDLRSAETVELKQGDFKLISLGVSMKLPYGYYAELVPRSSTFKNYGIIQTNSIGIIDESYCGEEDIWKMPVYATRDTTIEANSRIAQFRIVKKHSIKLKEVDHMEDKSRGGFGSTGK
jgi:dUTP pyrophosphatase